MKKVLTLIFCAVFMLVLAWAVTGEAQGNGGNTFKDPSLGYTISYPSGWTYAYQAPHIVIFSVRKATNEGATISLRNLNSTKVPGGKYKDNDAVLEALMNQLRKAKDVIVYEPEPFLYNKGQVRLTGKQVTAEYTIKGEKYKQWVVVVPRAEGDVFHMWSLVAPAKSYDAVLQAARTMLSSWTIQ
jgi:hypothetical protein